MAPYFAEESAKNTSIFSSGTSSSSATSIARPVIVPCPISCLSQAKITRSSVVTVM